MSSSKSTFQLSLISITFPSNNLYPRNSFSIFSTAPFESDLLSSKNPPIVSAIVRVLPIAAF